MVLDIINYFQGSDEYKTVQSLLGFNKLFREYIVKIWLLHDNISLNFKVYNRILAKMYIEFYYSYQIERNKVLHELKTLKRYISNEIRDVKHRLKLVIVLINENKDTYKDMM